jgi:6-phosphogluconolactonase
VELAREAIADHGEFTLALAGGSTPRMLYALLATENYAPRIDWSRVQLFWGDERPVGPDHPDSNYHMTRQALLRHISIPVNNLHRIRGELDPMQAASTYERKLRDFFAARPAQTVMIDDSPVVRLDMVLLGMGDDGHTASLFPHTRALHERQRWVAANYVEQQGSWRITTTPVLINAAHTVVFFVAGEIKAAVLRDVLHGPPQPETLPAQLVQPVSGRLHWMVDQTAASALEATR